MKLSPAWLNWVETKTLMSAFAGQEEKVRFVGGAVRDAMLGIQSEDIDLASVFTPEETTKILEAANIRVIPTGLKHGTITALIGKKTFEITTLRLDTSCDGRHAEVEFTHDWQEDAKRRDFTMNAMYLGFDGELYDYFGGAEDARAGRIKFIGEANDRIKEDYLRILRFFRFYAHYGKGEVDAEAITACAELKGGIENLSGERIQQEMLKLLAAKEPYDALKLMQESGVLEAVFGFNVGFQKQNSLDSSILRLTMLLLSANIPAQEALKKIAVRWKFSNAMVEHISLLISNMASVSDDMSVAEQKKIIRKLGNDIFSQIIFLKIVIDGEKQYSSMLKLAEEWQPPVFPISGYDLIELGIAQGKAIGTKLKKLEEYWEKNHYQPPKAELLTLATEAVAGDGSEK